MWEMYDGLAEGVFRLVLQGRLLWMGVNSLEL